MCPGRGAAFYTLHRSAGTQISRCRVGPGSAAHRFALRSIRGTLPATVRLGLLADGGSELTSRLQRLVDLSLQHRVEILRRDRSDQLVDDGPLAADDEGLRHAIDAPFDRGAAVAIDADDAERIAVAAEETPCVVGSVLVVDADELQPLVLAELGQQRRLVVTRHAPGRPDIDDTDLALEHGWIEPGHLRALVDEARERRQRRLRRRTADQRRWDF